MITPETHSIRRALISVSDKTGIIDFARALSERGIEIISTGGTARSLREAGIPVTGISSVTGFPEVMDGRVKTLHPKIHGGLLGMLDNPGHVEQMNEHDIDSIDLAVINLYPFEQTLQKADVGHEEIIENIDIGGPAMVRASAKNYRWTAIVVNPANYERILAALDEAGNTIAEPLRLQLAREAFEHTAYYDSLVAGYFARAMKDSSLPQTTLTAGVRLDQPLRYGENPHQSAALYGNFSAIFRQLHGKELSYNNIVDIDAAAKLVLEFDEPAVAIIKHTNPCGVAIGDTLAEAYRKAFASDTKSPFGGIIAFNCEVDMEAAQAVDEIFTEVLIAPSYSAEAFELLEKKKNRRLISADFSALRRSLGREVKSVAGGLLVQTSDVHLVDEAALKVVTKRQPTNEEHAAMMFAWKVAKHVKSNAIVYAARDRVLAVGAGQMSRVDSASIAAKKAAEAGIDLRGSAVASDAFFPFADGLLEAVEAGATSVIQPGGSIRDEEVVAAADDNNIAMMFTGMRHFRH
jgi:phosphoribosylaminoimidazolecarboxamide formyltransferase/IMP cyclohydrolase